MDVPAFCDSCGAVFRSGFVVENARNITFAGNSAGPCPNCGGMGHIPDGVFNFVGNTIEILSAPQRTIHELTRLAKIIHEAREKQQPPEAVAQKIREELPALARLADLLPRTRSELYGFLALIIAVVTLISQGGQRQSTNITVNQTISQACVGADKETAAPQRPAGSLKKVGRSAARQQSAKSPKKVGRNAPCPCGSGKKYKKCCGKIP